MSNKETIIAAVLSAITIVLLAYSSDSEDLNVGLDLVEQRILPPVGQDP